MSTSPPPPPVGGPAAPPTHRRNPSSPPAAPPPPPPNLPQYALPTHTYNQNISYSTSSSSDPDEDYDFPPGSPGADSSLGDTSTLSSTTTSLLSSVHNHTYENGRRYHGYRAGKYMLPNDDEELDRLDLYHHVWLMCLCGELSIYPATILPPPPNYPQLNKVLDVGTGTGIWAIDLAEKHPGTEVVGVDLSPTQPGWVPPNLKFEIDDVELEWTWPHESFSMVHMRNMAGALADWSAVLEQAWGCIEPGGVMALTDFDYILHSGVCEKPNVAVSRPVTADPASPAWVYDRAARPVADTSAFGKWWSLTVQSAAKAGRPFMHGHSMVTLLKEAGYVDVTARWEMWPFAPWARRSTVPLSCGYHPEALKGEMPANEGDRLRNLRERGAYAQMGILQGLLPYSIALLTRFSGWSGAEVEDLCEKAAEEVRGGGGEYWCRAWFVTGRKPVEGET